MSERLGPAASELAESARAAREPTDADALGDERRQLRDLIQITATLGSELSRPEIVAHVLATARVLVGAEYAALHSIGPDRSPGPLIHASGPRPGRAAAPSFEVEVEVEVEPWAVLAVAGLRPGHQLSATDQAVLSSLAAAAGSALTNAQRQADAALRQAWLAASAQITSTLLSADPTESLELVVRAARQLAEARLAWIALLRGDGARVEASDGVGALSLRGFEIDGPTPLLNDIVSAGQPVVLTEGSVRVGGLPAAMVSVLDGGPIMGIPLSASGQRRGALIIGNLPGAIAFSAVQVEMATTFAGHASLALELAQAEADRRQLTVVEERERIARDLHDVVIQRLFAIGLRVQGLRPKLPGPDAERVDETVDELDQTIDAIRNTVFSLRTDSRARASLRAELFAVVRQAAGALGFTPKLRVLGPNRPLGAGVHVRRRPGHGSRGPLQRGPARGGLDSAGRGDRGSRRPGAAGERRRRRAGAATTERVAWPTCDTGPGRWVDR